MHSLNDIRSRFLDFFRDKGHEVLPSSPLVPRNDPTLLFANAGMNQFKNVFTGAETLPFSRAATVQKCLRAGGKHNDLDNVGYTARHHTFFEMLGNFSFGDYFKDDAIALAWELLTKEFEIDPARLLVTIYHDDEEAHAGWKKAAGLPDEKIIRIATSDNFWTMGDTGPCGPCSEIFFDHGENIPGGPPGSPDEDGDRFVEIWNLVFMQFETQADGERIALPKPSIDTGMGLERIAAVMQGVHNNYDTDLFQHLIKTSARLTGTAPDGEHAIAHRVIADHLRAMSFLIADGVTPSNEGRGYVLRRIMRRAMRYAHQISADRPLMHRLAPSLIETMGDAYPELVRAGGLIQETLKLEEEKFKAMLVRGLKILEEEVSALSPGPPLPGEVAFKLYDTYGFPLDLTQDALRRRNIEVDTEGFDAAMARQKAAARAHWAGSGEEAEGRLWFEIRDRAGATDFLGYATDRAEGVVAAIVKEGESVDALKAGESGEIIFNQTPFYAESGGQIGDRGKIVFAGGGEFDVEDVKKRAGDLHSHVGKLVSGEIRVGDAATLIVDSARRNATRANHSATHLMHAALREVLGDHVTQKGSYVGPDRLRFDFSHPKAVSADELAEIERRVNAVIRGNAPVETRVMSYEDALEAGAIGLFGEKYGDEVRVLSMGEAPAERESDRRRPYSMELCGGTHVARTGDIGLFVIISEGAVGSGLRRIEALTGEAARLWLKDQAEAARAAAEILNVQPEELPQRLRALAEDKKRLERALADAKRKLALGGGDEGAAAPVETVGGLKFIGKVVDGVAAKDLRALVDDAKKKVGSGVVAFIGVNDGKAALSVGVTEDLTDRLSAVDLVRAGAAAVGGKGGGGRPDMAQAGGPNGAAAASAIDSIKSALEAA